MEDLIIVKETVKNVKIDYAKLNRGVIMDSVNTSELQVDEERMNNSIKQLKKWRDEVNNELRKEFKNHIKRAGEIHSEGARMVEFLEDYTLRSGKRIRPACVIAGYKGVGGKKHKEIVSASLSIEALQSYLLVHDDIMDEDPLRRGGPSLHKMYEDYHRKELNGKKHKKFGESMGIIAGDLANSFAIDQLTKSDFDSETKLKALKKFEQIHRYTGFGQALDAISENKAVDKIVEDDVLTVHRLKTAHYTIAGPLELGAVLGNGTEEQKKVLRDYGMNVGKGFQVYDDMLGLFGEKEKLGKPVDSDLKEGKRTILILKALEKGNEEQRQKIKNALGNPDITREDIEEVRKIVKETGSYEYSRKLTIDLVKKGKNIIKNTDKIDPEIVEFLLGIADYIITREV